MHWALLSKEILHNTRSERYRLLLALLIGLALAATAVRTQVYQQLAQESARAEVGRARVTAACPDDRLRGIIGRRMEKPPNPLSILCSGLENEMSRTVYTRAMYQDILGVRKLSSLFHRLNGPFDLASVIAMVCSLMALLLTFDAVSGERESGTMRLILAGPVPRATVLGAKRTAALVALVVPMLAATVLCVLYVMLVGRIWLGAAHLAAIGLLVLVAVLYISVFANAGIAFSAWSHSSATSLSCCLLLWLVAALVVPNTIPLLARTVVGGESRVELERGVLQAYRAADVKTAADTSAWWYSPRLPDTALGRSGRLVRTTIEAYPRIRGMQERYRATLHEQRTVAQVLVGVSPVSAFTTVSCDLTGTGVSSYAGLDEYWRRVNWASVLLWNRERVLGSIARFGPPPRTDLAQALVDNGVVLLMLVLYTVLLMVAGMLGFVWRRQE